ncbi:MAG: anti-sigma factor [Pseudomonadales bacterium]
MMMPTCQHVCEHASDYLEGEGKPFERFMLRMHLILCQHCRRFMRQFHLVMGLLPVIDDSPLTDEEEIERLIEKLMQAGA